MGKLRLAEWHSWPEAEVAAIKEALSEYWMSHLADPFPVGLQGWEELTDARLCAIAAAESDLSPYLDRWIEVQSPQSSHALALFLTRSSILADSQAVPEESWRKVETQYQTVRQWAVSPAVREKLERLAEDQGEDDKSELVKALTLISKFSAA